MRTLLLARFTENDSASAVSQTADAVAGLGNSRGVLIAIIVIGTIAGVRMASRAVAPIAEVIKSVVAAGLSALLMTAVVALALVLAVTSV